VVAGKQKLQPRKYTVTKMIALYAHTQHVKHANARGFGGMPFRKILKIACSEMYLRAIEYSSEYS